jgi:hypothetical protein
MHTFIFIYIHIGGRNLQDSSDVDNSTSFMDAIANSSNHRGIYINAYQYA